MAKYRAKTDAVHPYRTGDIVEFNDPLVDGFKAHFEPYDGDEAVTDIDARNPLNDPTAAGTQLNLGGKTPAGNEQNLDGEDGGEGGGSQTVINPSRDELKKEAEELGINFAQNIPTDRLLELIKEARVKKAAEDAAE